jgi:NADH-quinone oxidoreductase subunit F
VTEKIVSKNWERHQSWTLSAYEDAGGYKPLRKALKMKPEDVVGEVVKSSLRGRGGAGFATGMKWQFVRKETAFPKYLVINADEGEPGTFKDRYILEKDPHLFIEGCAIAAYAIDAHACYVYTRGEFTFQRERLEAAMKEAYAKHYLGKNILKSGFDLDLYSHRGAGAYICGEESALLESLEGRKGWPRLKPPFPANKGGGLFGQPTAVQNVETVANLPAIVEKGGDWFAALGPPKNGGTRLFCVSGCVARPGVYEESCGITLRQLVFDVAGGARPGRTITGVIPGGSSAAILAPDDFDTPMDFDSLRAKKTMAGSGGVIVFDDSVCMVRAARNLIKFYAHESCGQCTPCREGTGWVHRLISKIEAGAGTAADVDLVDQACKQMEMRTICALADGAAMSLRAVVQKYRGAFVQHVEEKRCPLPS